MLIVSLQVTELTQQIVSELWTLCSCNVSVIDDSLECNSASEGNYTAIVLSQSEDAESLVEEYYEALVEAIQGEFKSCVVSRTSFWGTLLVVAYNLQKGCNLILENHSTRI